MANASQRKDIRRAEKAAAIADANNREAITAIMSTIPGRAWLHGKLEFAGVFTDQFTSDPYQMYFMKGQRNFGLMMLADIMTHCPDNYLQMMREANERDQLNRAIDDDPSIDRSFGDDPAGREPAPEGFDWNADRSIDDALDAER